MRVDIDYKSVIIRYITDNNSPNQFMLHTAQHLVLTITEITYTNKTITLKVRPFTAKTKPITFIIHQTYNDEYISNITINHNNIWLRGLEDILSGECHDNYNEVIQKLEDSTVTYQYIHLLENCNKIILESENNSIKQQDILDALAYPNDQVFEFDYLTIDM